MITCLGCGGEVAPGMKQAKVGSSIFHELCLQCCTCSKVLSGSCYIKSRNIYCRDDYTKVRSYCDGCKTIIPEGDMVMKANTNIYHLGCFKCSDCGKQIEQGTKYILDGGCELICYADWTKRETLKYGHLRGQVDLNVNDDSNSFNDSMSDSSGDCKIDQNRKMEPFSKRPRTILNQSQRKLFKTAFESTPKPCRKIRDKLAEETGLSQRVVQVWFQNQRAKVKKIAKRQNDLRLAQQHGMFSNEDRFDHVNTGLGRLEGLYPAGQHYGQYYQKQEFSELLTNQDWRGAEQHIPVQDMVYPMHMYSIPTITEPELPGNLCHPTQPSDF